MTQAIKALIIASLFLPLWPSQSHADVRAGSLGNPTRLCKDDFAEIQHQSVRNDPYQLAIDELIQITSIAKPMTLTPPIDQKIEDPLSEVTITDLKNSKRRIRETINQLLEVANDAKCGEWSAGCMFKSRLIKATLQFLSSTDPRLESMRPQVVEMIFSSLQESFGLGAFRGQGVATSTHLMYLALINILPKMKINPEGHVVYRRQLKKRT